MDVRILFEAMEGLLSSSTGSLGAPGNLTEKLASNLSVYRALLGGSRLNGLKTKLDHYKAKRTFKLPEPTHSLENPTLALYSSFTSEAVALVAVLEDILFVLNEQDKAAAAAVAAKVASGLKVEGLPAAPQALLSVSEVKTLHSLLEFVVSLGVFPFLQPGVDAHLARRLKHAASIAKAGSLSLDCSNILLYNTCIVIKKCFENEVIGAPIIKRHLSDILAALIQVCYGSSTHLKPTDFVKRESQASKMMPSIKSPAEIAAAGECSVLGQIGVGEKCMELLQSLLRDTHQPLVIKELLILQGMGGGVARKVAGSAVGGSPKWLCRTCGELLSERLMTSTGVHHVITAIIDIAAGGDSVEEPMDWRKCKMIARILSSCPKQAPSLEDYYSVVCPQILDLVHGKSTGQPHFRVAVETISLMITQSKSLSQRYLLQPLTRPLHWLIAEECEVSTKSQELEACVYDLRKIGIVVECSSPILTSLFPFSPIFFHLWRENIQHSKLRYIVCPILLGTSFSISKVFCLARHCIA